MRERSFWLLFIFWRMSTTKQVICLLSEPLLPDEQKGSGVEERTEKANFSSCAKTPEDLIETWSQLWRQDLSPVTTVQLESFLVPGLLFLLSNPWDWPPHLPSDNPLPCTCMELPGRHRSGALLLTFLLFVLLLHALVCVYPFKLDPFRHLCSACKLSTLVQWKTALLRLRQGLHRKTKVCSTCCLETMFTLWVTCMYYPPETSTLFQMWKILVYWKMEFSVKNRLSYAV